MATQVLGTAVIQDITYTEKQLGSGVTVSYTNGATAGSEVVSVSGLAITIQISTGVSTATQVKAAFDASLAALALATCAITGTAGTAQVTVNQAFLSGGVAVATATLNIGGVLKLTSVASGTAGNSIRFRFTSGATAGSEVVTVSTNDISVQIADGVSTWAQVKTAYDASSAAIALATSSLLGPATSSLAYVASMNAYTNLAGGVAAAAAVRILQDLTFTAPATGVAGNLVSITYTTGATAGSEVVTVSGNAVSIQISNGVSTATQIRTAFNLVGAATTLATCTISGTGATAQKTVNVAPTTTSEAGVGAEDFYVDQGTALTASYVWFPFGFVANAMRVDNDETATGKDVVLSFDGVNVDSNIKFGKWVEYIPMRPVRGVWLKYGTAAPSYRVHAWKV